MIFACISDYTEQDTDNDQHSTEDGYDHDEPYPIVDRCGDCGYRWREMERWGERGEGGWEERVREGGREGEGGERGREKRTK